MVEGGELVQLSLQLPAIRLQASILARRGRAVTTAMTVVPALRLQASILVRLLPRMRRLVLLVAGGAAGGSAGGSSAWCRTAWCWTLLALVLVEDRVRKLKIAIFSIGRCTLLLVGEGFGGGLHGRRLHRRKLLRGSLLRGRLLCRGLLCGGLLGRSRLSRGLPDRRCRRLSSRSLLGRSRLRWDLAIVEKHR